VIEDVEDLRAELDVESPEIDGSGSSWSPRNPGLQVWPNDGIAARIAKEIGASAGNAGLSLR